MKPILQTRFTKQRIGVQIKNDQLICVAATYNKYKIKTLTCAKLPLGDDDFAFKNKLLTLKEYFGKRAANFIYGLSEQDIIFKQIELQSRLTEREILLYLQSNSNEFFGCSFRDLYFDYTLNSEKNNTQTLSVFAAQRNTIDQLTNCFHEAGYKLIAVNILSDAILRIIQFVFQSLKRMTTIIWHTGNTLLLYVYHKDSLCYFNSRELSNDPDSFTSLKATMLYFQQHYSSQNDTYSIPTIYLISPKNTKTHLTKLISFIFNTTITDVNFAIKSLLPYNDKDEFDSDYLAPLGLTLWKFKA